MIKVSKFSFFKTFSSLFLLFLLSNAVILGNEGVMTLPSDETMAPPVLPEFSPIPEKEEEKIDSDGTVWVLEKSNNILLESRIKVVVPLEIISDLDVKALIIDDQNLEIPFEIELNKEPERVNYYRLNYSETAIDIDGDGSIDTTIHSPKYLNGKIVSENILKIDGKNISREGTHRKKIYLTIELTEGDM